MRNDASARSWVGRHRTAAEIGAGLLAFAAVLGITFFQWGPTVDGAIRGITLGGWVALAVYLVVRRRRVAEEQRASAAVDQRLRIARELHDTVAGAVSSIGIQAAAARRVLRTSPDDAALALERIESASRGANADLRRMLDALREGGPMSAAPEAGLDRLEALAEETRASGPDVRLSVDPAALALGDPALDHAAYRIVQEALTNVVRHAGAVPVEVDVRIRPDRVLDLSVVNGPGSEARPSRHAEAGLGLTGMRERTALFGGAVDAGPTPDGGFAVRATLPLDGRR